MKTALEVFRVWSDLKFLFVGPAIVLLCLIINLLTAPSDFWAHWPALGIGIAWVISFARSSAPLSSSSASPPWREKSSSKFVNFSGKPLAIIHLPKYDRSPIVPWSMGLGTSKNGESSIEIKLQ